MHKKIKLAGVGYIETLIGLVLISGVLLFLLGTATYYIKVATNLEAKDYMQNTATVYGRLIQGILLNTEDISYQKNMWEKLSKINTPFKFIKDNDTNTIGIQTTSAQINEKGQIQTEDDDLILATQLKVFENSNIINKEFLEALESQSEKDWLNRLGIVIEKVDTTFQTENIIKLKLTIACLESQCKFKPVVMYYYIYNPIPTTDNMNDYGNFGGTDQTGTPTPTNENTPTPTPTPTPTRIITPPDGGGGGGIGIGDPTPTTATQ